jgi:hypothetical protein
LVLTEVLEVQVVADAKAEQVAQEHLDKVLLEAEVRRVAHTQPVVEVALDQWLFITTMDQQQVLEL